MLEKKKLFIESNNTPKYHCVVLGFSLLVSAFKQASMQQHLIFVFSSAHNTYLNLRPYCFHMCREHTVCIYFVLQRAVQCVLITIKIQVYYILHVCVYIIPVDHHECTCARVPLLQANMIYFNSMQHTLYMYYLFTLTQKNKILVFIYFNHQL